MEEWHKKMQIAEQAFAVKNPIDEASVGLDDSQFGNPALRLYANLVPAVKSHSF